MRQNIGDVGVQNKRKATDQLSSHPVFPSANEFRPCSGYHTEWCKSTLSLHQEIKHFSVR